MSVKGGGHHIAGKSVCEGGFMIDLSLMKSTHVDAARLRARAGGGAKWGDFDAETQSFGLAPTGGTNTDTGIAGLTLGGGIGWLAGRYGLTCDNLTGANVVLADVGDDDQTGDARIAFRAETFERLSNLKAKYDPTNFFRLNPNIPPSG